MYVFEETGWRLKERGVTTRFIHRGSNPAEEVQGSIFTMNGQTFKASKVDWKFSYANLCSTIEKNQFVANTAKKVMERTEIDGRRISEYLRQVEQIEQEKENRRANFVNSIANGTTEMHPVYTRSGTDYRRGNVQWLFSHGR